MSYRIHSGVIAGRDHIKDVRNCQDALCTLKWEQGQRTYLVGVLADGCSQGMHSEVGAQLITSFVAENIRHHLLGGMALADVPRAVFDDTICFLQRIVALYQFSSMKDFVAYVENHLLFTLLGCVVCEEEAITFAAGDGIILLNDQLYILDQQNAPLYLGYHVLERRFLRDTALPDSFELYQLPAGESLRRLALGSDAWISEQALLDQIWGNRGRGDLKLRMNSWSNARHFKDDASLIVIERCEDER